MDLVVVLLRVDRRWYAGTEADAEPPPVRGVTVTEVVVVVDWLAGDCWPTRRAPTLRGISYCSVAPTLLGTDGGWRPFGLPHRAVCGLTLGAW